jgi:dTDP-4-dehydrorhamnose 3,5-epimerase
VDPATIAGVRLTPLEPHPDLRGSLTELYRRSRWVDGQGLVQANLSRSSPGVLRGLHFHRLQSDLWVPVEGRATVGLHDLRRGSPTGGRAMMVTLDAAEPVALSIPPGVGHGFATTEGFVLLYLVDREYAGDDEWGVAWNDPGLGIGWGLADPLLSERDRTNPPLAEALADPPAYP